jgi:hypothetical protein
MSLLDTASLIVTPNGYKEGTLYSVIPSDGSGDMSVVRATTATRVNSAGLIESVANNIPRLDYSNGTCPSLLVEPQRTNLLAYSEQFDNLSYWTTYNASITANTTISPSGIQNADTITPSATTGGDVYRLITLNGTYTATCYFKSGTATTARIGYSNGDLGVYNLTNQTIVTTGSVTATIEDAGNGWYRCSLTTTITAGAYVAYSSNGTTGQTIHLWGAQLELASYATSYIPTTSASVTRNADVISKTGISSLIGQTEGTMFLDVDFTEVSDYNGWFMKDVANFDTFAFIQRETSGIIAVGYYGSGALQARIETAPSQPIGRYKIGFGYKNNDFVLYINGTQIGIDTSGSVSGLMNFLDAHYSSTGSTLQNAIALWKTRLTNTQLAQLTTI